MDKRKVRKFKNQQKRLAKKVAQELGSKSFTVNYEQQLPSTFSDAETGKLKVANISQIIFPTDVVCKGKSRVIVVMYFEGSTCNSRVIGKILRRHFLIKILNNGFEVRSSFNPRTIGKLK